MLKIIWFDIHLTFALLQHRKQTGCCDYYQITITRLLPKRVQDTQVFQTTLKKAQRCDVGGMGSRTRWVHSRKVGRREERMEKRRKAWNEGGNERWKGGREA